jgi:hypothetical protein
MRAGEDSEPVVSRVFLEKRSALLAFAGSRRSA